MKGENVQMISSKKDIKFVLEKGKIFGEFLTIIYINDNSLTNHLELLISFVPKKKLNLLLTEIKLKRRIRSFFLTKQTIN